MNSIIVISFKRYKMVWDSLHIFFITVSQFIKRELAQTILKSSNKLVCTSLWQIIQWNEKKGSCFSSSNTKLLSGCLGSIKLTPIKSFAYMLSTAFWILGLSKIKKKTILTSFKLTTILQRLRYRQIPTVIVFLRDHLWVSDNAIII